MIQPLHNTEDHETTREQFKIDLPEYYNFGYDVIDAWARKDRNKLAMIRTNPQGDEKMFSFPDIANLSNQEANVLPKIISGKIKRNELREREQKEFNHRK